MKKSEINEIRKIILKEGDWDEIEGFMNSFSKSNLDLQYMLSLWNKETPDEMDKSDVKWTIGQLDGIIRTANKLKAGLKKVKVI